MRHEQIADKASYAKVEFAAAWPALAQVAPAPLPEDAAAAEAFVATPSCPDVPAAAGGLIAASYVGLVATFAVAMTGSAQSVFAIVICGVFLAAFFAVPRIFLGVERSTGRRPSLDRFMREGMATMTGHSSGRDALIQMLIVPVLLTLGVVVMGIAAAIIL